MIWTQYRAVSWAVSRLTRLKWRYQKRGMLIVEFEKADG